MASPPLRGDLADTPTVGAYKLAIGELYDYATSLLGNSSTATASDSEKQLARSALGVSELGQKNKIINGIFAINQRAVSGTVNLSAGAYGHDRFKAGSAGCSYTFSTVGGVTTITIASGTLTQVVDGINIKSGAHVLSWSGTAQGRINSGTYGASGTVKATLTNGTNATIEFNAGTLTMVQLEFGETATGYDYRHYLTELNMCQHYFWRITSTVSQRSIGLAQVYSGTAGRISLQNPVAMRANPTSLEMVGVGLWQSGSTVTQALAFAVASLSTDVVSFNLTGMTGLFAGDAATFVLIGVGGYISVSAEI